jgi:hypothetical protein
MLDTGRSLKNKKNGPSRRRKKMENQCLALDPSSTVQKMKYLPHKQLRARNSALALQFNLKQ